MNMGVLQYVVVIIVFVAASNMQLMGQEKSSKAFSRLVWSDEFNYTGRPDTSKWQYEQGFVRGTESQIYTRERLENANVQDGCLVITAKKEKYKNPSFTENKKTASTDQYPSQYKQMSRDSIPATIRKKFDSTAEYTSASLITAGKASWQYGRLEVKAKLPAGKGLWPAIWMLGVNRSKVGWPKCGEIDIMEHVGKNPSNIHATLHYKDERTGKRIKTGSKIKAEDLSTAFHLYSMEWDSSRIQFFFDDKLYHTFKIEQAGTDDYNPFRKPFYLLINLALGGSWGGKIDDTALPGNFIIDYVRYYQ